MQIEQAVLDWLLDERDPSVRYRTLTELLDQPRDDPLAQRARAQIADSAPVQAVMTKIHPDGYWLYQGKGQSIDYAGFRTTHFALALLAEFGMDRSDPRISRAVERYLSLKPSEGFAYVQPPDYSTRQSCLYAYNLRTFVMLGYRDDPRIQERVEVLLADDRRDGGYLCIRQNYRPSTKSCIRGSIKALMAYAMLPETWKTPRCLKLVDYFIRRRVFYRSSPPDQIIRGELVSTVFPTGWRGNLIEPLYALSVMGYGQHEALDDAWAHLAEKRDDQGRYLLDWAPAGFVHYAKQQPNKWITLYAYLALKHRANASIEP